VAVVARDIALGRLVVQHQSNSASTRNLSLQIETLPSGGRR